MVPVLPGQAFDASDGNESIGPEAGLEPLPKWFDPLNDLSGVYQPPGGLVGIEVLGGEARLQSGYQEGRYNTVFIEADLPGDSWIEISVLDATTEPSEVGFANETIVGYKRIAGTDLSVYSINPSQYPSIRIQVNLKASGADRPMVLSWSLQFIDMDEWRDDFLGTGKMASSKGINVTNGVVELNLTKSSGSSSGGDYDAYPPIIVAGASLGMDIHKANAAKDGYTDGTSITYNGYSEGVAFADLDSDGDLDVVIADAYYDCWIMWGDGSGSWSMNGAKELQISEAWKVGTGDFNGDGEVDIAFARYDYYEDTPCVIYLNQGGGDFNNDPDITFTGTEGSKVAVGDLDGDGIDDVAFTTLSTAVCFYGAASGPDITADLTLDTTSCRGVEITDLDGDGWSDIVLADNHNGGAQVFMGSENGPDATSDYTLSVSASTKTDVAMGDVNGDGFKDIVMCTYTSGGYRITTFPGSSSGWSGSTAQHTDELGYSYAIAVADIDKDGYDDVAIAYWKSPSYRLAIFMGGESLPSGTGTEYVTNSYIDIAFAIPKGSTSRGFHGSFETEQITLPQGKSWDILHLEGALSQNSTMSMSVLDSSGREIHGYKDIKDWNVDLSGLSGYRIISIKVSISSEFNWSTPVLDGLLVKWIDDMTWRDQFFGSAKIAATSNMGVLEGSLRSLPTSGGTDQLLFTSLRDDEGYNSKSQAFVDSGDLDLLSTTPISFNVRGASASSVGDVNGDGYTDVAFAVYQTSDTNYFTKSVVFFGSAVGWRSAPDHEFDTTGASDILLTDLDGDGHTDLVIAQEQDGDTYLVDSMLFWGGPEGWSDTADVRFTTTGASGVAAPSSSN